MGISGYDATDFQGLKDEHEALCRCSADAIQIPTHKFAPQDVTADEACSRVSYVERWGNIDSTSNYAKIVAASMTIK